MDRPRINGNVEEVFLVDLLVELQSVEPGISGAWCRSPTREIGKQATISQRFITSILHKEFQMRISVIKSAVVGMAVAAAALIGSSTASAQCGSITIDELALQQFCTIVNGQKVLLDPVTGVTYSGIVANGNGTFTLTGNGVNPCSVTLAPQSINATVVDPVLGNVVTTYDASRPATPSTVVSNQVASEFPATGDIYFHATATVSSRPGRLYRTINEIHLQNPQLRTFKPHRQETYNLVDPVDYEDVNIPGVVAFTVTSISVTLN